MSSAARAYRSFGYEEAYQPSRPSIRVAQTPAAKPQGVSFVTVAIATVVLLCAITAFAFVHVWLDAQSITLSVQEEAVATELTSIRHEGSLLEVEVSSLANPSRIQSEAKELGMISPDNATVIMLPTDVVVTNSAGNLSLAGSAQVLAQFAEA